MVALWDAFYIEDERFDLDTLWVPNRSPTPISKSNDFLGLSDDIWGARGLHFLPILGVPGARPGLENTSFFSPLSRPPCLHPSPKCWCRGKLGFNFPAPATGVVGPRRVWSGKISPTPAQHRSQIGKATTTTGPNRPQIDPNRSRISTRDC